MAIYAAWQAGQPGAGPHRIDRLGRVLKGNAIQKAKKSHHRMPGQIREMVADYLSHEVFLKLSKKTQKEYRIYLDLFVQKFGDAYWHRLAPGTARSWLLERSERSGPAGAHALYRTVRAFFGKVRLCYDDVDHPGFVREDATEQHRSGQKRSARPQTSGHDGTSSNGSADLSLSA